METLIQWDLFAQGGLQLATDDNLAGNGALFLLVGDIATERQRLRNLGISLGDDIQGTYSTLAQVRDPDGNQLTLATPPSPSIPAGMTSELIGPEPGCDGSAPHALLATNSGRFAKIALPLPSKQRTYELTGRNTDLPCPDAS
jgi:hypothetical protein